MLAPGGDEADEHLRRAESRLQRALTLNPQLASVTRKYAQLESDMGRSMDGLMRLLTVAPAMTASPARAGLVHACRALRVAARPRWPPTNALSGSRSDDRDERAPHPLAPGDATAVEGVAGGRFAISGRWSSLRLGQDRGGDRIPAEMERAKRPELMKPHRLAAPAARGQSAESIEANGALHPEFSRS